MRQLWIDLKRTLFAGTFEDNLKGLLTVIIILIMLFYWVEPTGGEFKWDGWLG